MSDLPLPTLDRLHAETSSGEWRAGSVETDAVFVPCSDCMGPERVILRMNKSFPHEADAKWIATIHNTWPTISARLKELESELEATTQNEANLYASQRARIQLLEETLRGILQEKREAHSACAYDPIDADRLKGQIDQIERVLKGEV